MRWICCFLVLSSSVVAQTADTASARAAYRQGVRYSRAAKYDSARFELDRAEGIYRTAGMWREFVLCLDQHAEVFRSTGQLAEAMAFSDSSVHVAQRRRPQDTLLLSNVLYTRGIVLSSQGRFEESLSHHERVYEMRSRLLQSPHADLSGSLNNLGIINYNLGRFESALAWHEKSLAMRRLLSPNDPLPVGQAYLNIGVIYRVTFQLSKALECYEEALKAYSASLGENHPRTAIVLHNLGIVYDLMGDFDRAREFYEKALRIRLDRLGPDHPDVAFSLNDLANLLNNQKNWRASLALQNEALTIAEKKWGDKHPFVAAIYNNRGNNYFELQLTDSAEYSYRRGEELNRKLLGDEHPETIRGLTYRARILSQQSQPDSAIATYRSAIAAYRSIYGERHADIAGTYLRMADVFREKGKLSDAVDCYENALVALVDWPDTTAVPMPSLWSSENVGLETLTRLARLHIDLYLADGDSAHLQNSLHRATQAAALYEQIRRAYRSEGSKLFLAEQTQSMFEVGLEAAWRMYERDPSAGRLEEAWMWAERAKGSVLLESLADAQAHRYSDLPDSMLRREDELREKIVFTDTQFQREWVKGPKRDSVLTGKLADSLFRLNREYREFISQLETSYPRYYQFKYQTVTPSLKGLQGKLSPGTAVVHYTMGDSAWYVFTISSTSLSGIRMPSDTSIRYAAQEMRNGITSLDFEKYVAAAYDLWEALLRPLPLDGFRELIVVPDRYLYQLPFEAFLTKKTKTPRNIDFSKLSYANQRFAIRYVPSASVIAPVNALTPRSLLAVAPVFTDTTQRQMLRSVDWENEGTFRSAGRTLSELPHSRVEVESIAGEFSNRKLNATVLLLKDATETAFRTQCSSYQILHVATHGFVHSKSAKLSGIVFSPESGAHDGVLYVPEMVNLRMNAELVTISACKSGVGKIVKGEGIIGLTRALSYAGAKRTLVSLWQVEDKATAELMTRFYRRLLQGKSYAVALQEAKNELIVSRSTSFPGDWSSFVLMSP